MTATAQATATTTTTRSRGLRRLVTVVGTTVAALLLVATPALAYSGTLNAWGGSATYDDSTTLTGWRVAGTVTDTLADGTCATVYLRGRNYVIGYGNWETAGRACGKGTSVRYDSRFSLYSDQVYVKLCAQTCTAVTRAH